MTTPTTFNSRDQESPHRGKSIVAVTLGFLTVFILSMGTDQILHILKVYPPWGVPMWGPGLNALALAYRLVYTVLGGYVTARLAPRNPMYHVWILAWIGLVLGGIGAVIGFTHP